MNSLCTSLVLLLFFVFTLNTNTQAQTSHISGVVLSEQGTPVVGAHIYISESSWGVSEKDGSFLISEVAPGSYHLQISSIGFASFSAEVEVPQKEENPTFTLTELVYKNPGPVVITASRTRKELEDVSVPVSVIEREEITKSGSMRLSDILEEQIGLNLVSDHGTGIQVQGFDPEYTLILIDNQPVIGRTAGTLDLTRLAVGNIQQIEIVKGPSSALWGSEALAGVINIITDKGNEPFSWDINGRFGNFNTYDAASTITFKANKLSGRFFGNINGSDGYDLIDSTLAPTVAEYQNYTFSAGLDYRATPNLTLKLGSRFYNEDLFSRGHADVNGTRKVLVGDDFQQDYNFTPEIFWTIGSSQLLEFTGFTSRYKSQSTETIEETGENYYFSTFDQTLNKLEAKSTTFWNKKHTSVFGTGLNREDLISENYSEVPTFTSGFFYGQHEWQLREDISFTTGFRFDAHSEYQSQLSPKFSALYKPSNMVHIRASLGSGFKAPTFNQLFLNFTNATVGYTVFGTSNVVPGMEGLLESGRIEEVIVPAATITDIGAENSFSYNVGVDLFPTNTSQFKVNFFRNNIQDMIDSQQIALKTNGQYVFSYFNLNKVYTQGFETEFRYRPALIPGFNINVGYQFLDARQKFEIPYDVVENGVVISKTRTEYGILPNRSRHTGTLKFFYTLENLGLESSLRATFRGKFGVDSNGNARIDANEYVYTANNLEEAIEKTILNFSLAKTFYSRFRLMVGIDNLTNFTNTRYLPSNPGRTFFTQLNIKLH